MSWFAFFVVWALLCVAFVAGCGWARRGRVRAGHFHQVIKLVYEGLAREARLRARVEALSRLLDQATKRQPRITTLPGVESEPEGFDWKRGTGVE